MSLNQESNIFLDLATLIGAGISILDAARRVAESYPNLTEWQLVIRSLEKGTRLSLALRKSGIISRFENEVISIAEDAGRVEQGLTYLSDSYQKRTSRISQLKSKLYYPFAILTVGIIVAAILSLVRNPDISLVVVLIKAILQFVLALYLTQFILSRLNRDSCFWLTKLNQYESKHWYKVQFQQLLFEAMHWHISSGIDHKTSFSRISKLFNSPSLTKKLLKTANGCDQGLSVSNAMRQANLPITIDMMQLFSTGEHSGQLETTLKRQLELNQFEAEMKIDNLFEWVPRLYYGAVVILVIITII